MKKDINVLLISTLEQELPKSLFNKIDDFKFLVNNHKFRSAFLVLDELKDLMAGHLLKS